MKKKVWGQLLSLNLSGCDFAVLSNGKQLAKFFPLLCREIKMTPYGKPIVKRFATGELEGYSGMQFIETSSITVHCDETDERVFIDIFSCKVFDIKKAAAFCKTYFKSSQVKAKNFYRD